MLADGSTRRTSSMAGPSAFMNTPSAFNGQAPHPAASAAAAIARANLTSPSPTGAPGGSGADGGKRTDPLLTAGPPHSPQRHRAARSQLEVVREDSPPSTDAAGSPSGRASRASQSIAYSPAAGKEVLKDDDDGDVLVGGGSDRRRMSSGRHARYTEQVIAFVLSRLL